MSQFQVTFADPQREFFYRNLGAISLHHVESHYPELHLQVLSDSTDQQVLKFAQKGRIGLSVNHANEFRNVHRGRIASIRRVGRSLYFRTIPTTGRHHLTAQTRTFPSADRTPRPVFELRDFQSAFSDVQNLSQLDTVVGSLTQFRETNLAFLNRVAQLCNKRLHVADEAISIVSNGGLHQHVLKAQDIDPDSVEWMMAMEPCSWGGSVWDFTSGRAPSSPTVSSADYEPWLTGISSSRELAEPSFSTDYPLQNPNNQSMSDWAAAKNAASLHRAFFWRGKLHNIAVRAGDLVQLPEGSAFTGWLRVVEQTLFHDPKDSRDSLVNQVELRLKEAREEIPPQPPVELHHGEVVHSKDSEKLGLIAVRLPWQPPGQFVMGCVPQLFSGAFVQPLPGDWVSILFPPHSIHPPVVLGSRFSGNRQAPVADGTEEISFCTPEGLVIRLRRGEKMIELGLLDGKKQTVWLSIGNEGIKVQGHVRMQNGKIFLE